MIMNKLWKTGKCSLLLILNGLKRDAKVKTGKIYKIYRETNEKWWNFY
jgi:hypothetical protein